MIVLAPLSHTIEATQRLLTDGWIMPGVQLVGGLEKLSRGWKKFLASGWTLKIAYAPHIQDLTSGLEKLRSLCEAYLCQEH